MFTQQPGRTPTPRCAASLAGSILRPKVRGQSGRHRTEFGARLLAHEAGHLHGTLYIGRDARWSRADLGGPVPRHRINLKVLISARFSGSASYLCPCCSAIGSARSSDAPCGSVPKAGPLPADPRVRRQALRSKSPALASSRLSMPSQLVFLCRDTAERQLQLIGRAHPQPSSPRPSTSWRGTGLVLGQVPRTRTSPQPRARCQQVVGHGVDRGWSGGAAL